MKLLSIICILIMLAACQKIQHPTKPATQALPEHMVTHTVYNNDEVDRPAQLLVKIEPRYPLKAFRENTEGYVVLRYVLSTAGAPTEIRVIEAEPKGVFEKEAKLVLSKWRFVPAKKNGRPVMISMQETMLFKLKDYQ